MNNNGFNYNGNNNMQQNNQNVRPMNNQGMPQNIGPMNNQGIPQNIGPMNNQGIPQNVRPMNNQGIPQNVRPMNNQGMPQNIGPMNNQGMPQNIGPMNNQGMPQNIGPMNNQGMPQNIGPMNNQGMPQNIGPMNNQGMPQNVGPMNNQGMPQNVGPMNNQGIPQNVRPMNNQGMPQNKVKTKSKKRLIITLSVVWLVLTIGIICLFFAFKDPKVSRTIMIYMVGSDLESENGMATLDIKEIEKSGIDLSENNVIVYAGGANKWKNNFENNAIYELKETGFELVKKDSKLNMGSASTLSNFLNYVTDNYNSESYGLILWNHGAGPILGYGVDETFDDDLLMLEELKIAFDNSEFSLSNKLEFIGFDACLMASVEIAAILSDYTDYMIASQESEPGYGWDYQFLSNVTSDLTTEELGKSIIDYMYDYYQDLIERYNGRYTFYTTLSLLDLTKIDELEESINDLFIEVDVALSNNGYSKIVSQITKAKSFGYSGYEKSYDLVDLIGISEQLVDGYEDKANALKSSVDDVVIYQKTNVDGANGLSIYYPYYTKSLIKKFLEIYEKLEFADNYTDFLLKYSEILSGEKLYDYSLKSYMPQLSNNSELISVSLDEDVVASYNNASYVIFRDMKDGYYMPVYKSSDTELNDDGTLIANFNKKQLSVTDDKGEAGWATMNEYIRTDSYVIYNVPAVIIKMKDGMESKSVNIQLKVDEQNPNGKIMGVVPVTNVEDVSSAKKIINLEEWEYIQFFNAEYDFYDENGMYTDDWQSSGTVYLTEVSIEKGYEIEFVNLEEEYDYYCMFQIHDTQGNTHYTNLVKVD